MISVLLLSSIFIIVTGAVYLILQKTLLRVILGLNLLGGVVNLIIFLSGYNFVNDAPVLTPAEAKLTHVVADPLPQALILTAIVIGFAMLAFFVVTVQKTFEQLKTDDLDQMKQGDYL